MHALFEHLSFAAPAEQLDGLSRFLGRALGANEAERSAAVAAVTEALTHPLFARIARAEQQGQLHREAPVVTSEPSGELREGVVDLAFREADYFVLVDFKTDVTIGDLTVYARQLGIYADALTRALALPVKSVLFRV